jgi:exonuclease III
MKYLFFAFSILLMNQVAYSQSNFKVMSYNLLNFPEGQMPSRIDTLEIILDAYRPDLFMIQELKSAAGLAQIEDVLDNLGYGNFATSTFVAQQSVPGTSNPLQQAIAYNQSKFGLADEGYIITGHRDINYFKLFLKDADLENGADTSFVYAVVCHLKSSEGSENEQARLEMIQDYFEWHNANVDGIPVIFGGDFNVYTSAEPCYQALLAVINSPRLYDPISSPGSWNNNGSFSAIHTQSTRVNTIFNDGASGGMDDRFDQVLLSESFFNLSSPLRYVDDSYAAFGNSGNCFNDNITDCSGGDWSEEVRSALYYMSDHLPVVLEMEADIDLNTTRQPVTAFNVQYVGTENSFNVQSDGGQLSWTAYSITGAIIAQGSELVSAGNSRIEIAVNPLDQAMYLLSFEINGSYRNLKMINLPGR